MLHDSIEYLKGVGPKRAALLQNELNIHTFEDLLYYYPFRYIDKSKYYKIKDIQPDLPFIQIVGTLVSLSKVGKPRSKRLVGKFKDETGTLELIWFKGVSWVAKTLQVNKQYVAFGKPTIYNRKFNIAHPELELFDAKADTLSTGLEPVYNTTEKLKANWINSRAIMKLQRTLLANINSNELPENLSEEIIRKYRFISRFESLNYIHFPKDEEVIKKAIDRIKFEELFFIQLKLLLLKLDRFEKIEGHEFKELGNFFNTFYNERLDFELTGAQKKVVKEIRKDVGSGKQMNRLLQGDVGSGKTVVALMAMLIGMDNGFQTCMMAPTEILAVQHYNTVSKLFAGMGISIELLTGSIKGAKRKQILEDAFSGELKLLIGTHALIEEEVKFKNLGIAIIDEQHRFGVKQRARLHTKNEKPPHILIMTATPIPRTLALTLYGDLDVSIIDELPPGRIMPKTVHKNDSNRLRIFGFLKEQIKEGRQAFIVYPLIEESEKMDYKDLMDGYEGVVREFAPPQYQISIVHGRMKSEDKDYEMQRFINKETQIMVATTVIEVGVDIPNATVMVIESAQRFGLSQLHQLRGRIGRGADQSYCILMTDYKLSSDARLRIDTMLKTSDGFVIAEVDLKLRGPGDIEGTQQSGLIPLRLANLALDGAILEEARKSALKLLEEDPHIESPQNRGLNRFLKQHKDEMIGWSKIA
ncbi:MAG: ATP-dependent DNA helicase RecG [Bacteroidetes bacterium]|nr:ATP-dependent DNA helicase RecG [Bacteroidota bacterium]